MTKAEPTYEQKSDLEHAKLRPSMLIGSTELQHLDLFVYDGERFALKTVRFTPGWYKIVDEIVVNAIDHWVKHPKLVKRIDIQFDAMRGGVITVRNDGPTIPIKQVANLAGTQMYVAQMVCSEFRSGTNWNENRIVGGMNGIGMKATNAFSTAFTIVTCDGKQRLEQRFEDGMEIKHLPVLTKVARGAGASVKSFTEVEFLPDYRRLGYSDELTAEDYAALECLIHTRAIQAALCTDAEVFFNHHPVCLGPSKTKMLEFVRKFLGEAEFVSVEVKETEPVRNGGYPFQFCVATTDGVFQQVALINGIYCFGGGTVVNWFRKQVVAYAKDKLTAEVQRLDKESKVNINIIQNSLFLFLKGHVVDPKFNSQSKEQLTNSEDKFRSYQLTPRQLEEIWQFLKPHLIAQFVRKLREKDAVKKVRTDNIDKYAPARKAGTKDWLRTTLFICEGDSASGAAKTGITSQSTPIGWDLFGIYSIQGVPPNSRKMTSEFIGGADGEATRVITAKLRENKRLSDLMAILGLSYSKTYALTPEGDAEFKTLRYGCVSILVDQDLDGFNICGLLLSWFHQMWPHLFRRNYFKKLDTPIVRVYRDKQRRQLEQEFYNQTEYTRWVEETFEGHQDRIPSSWSVIYYKGLASHSPQETARLFMDYTQKVIHFLTNEESEEKIDIYYGKESDKRKQVLKTVEEPLDRRLTRLPLPSVMDCLVKPAQRYNILRKLVHVCDGMTIAKRKVLYTARHVFKQNNVAQRVSTFSGQVQSYAHYHHGEMSLNKTIVGMAQCFRGAKHIPMLYPEGNFGNYFNVNKAGSPRYIATRLNKAACFALYPERDDPVLTYEFDEGHRCEPQYYVPVLPTALLEHVSIPGTGWACRIWARSFDKVVEKTKLMIARNGNVSDAELRLPVWKDHPNAKLVRHNNVMYSVGQYTLHGDTLVITDLPLRVFTEQYIGEPSDTNSLCAFPEVSGIPTDDSLADGSKVYIEIKLKPGAVDEIFARYGVYKDPEHKEQGYVFDPIESRFRLKVALNSSLNLIHTDKSILELEGYSEILRLWFAERKQLYGKRIRRELTLLKLRARFLENVIRFSQNHETYAITAKTPRDQVDACLQREQYDRFNHVLLEQPKCHSEEHLTASVVNCEGASYDYLMNLRYSDLIANACATRERNYKSVLQEIRDLQDDVVDAETPSRFTGQKTWLRELENADRVLSEGMATQWGMQYELDASGAPTPKSTRRNSKKK